MRKALVIGLDCAAPDLLFNKFLHKLPNCKKIKQKGIYGQLESCDLPITIPAWAVMTSGKDPGTLGVYGFRHRTNNSINDIWITTSNHIKEKRIWDYVSLAARAILREYENYRNLSRILDNTYWSNQYVART